MFDLKVINSVLEQLEEERGIPRTKVIDAIEQALATAYKKEYGKKGQIVRAKFNVETGETEFFQVKIVVDDTRVRFDEEGEEGEELPEPKEGEEDDDRLRFNPEHHILIDDAHKIKRDAILDDEILFPLEEKTDYGRIAAQTAKQVIIQKIREAEKVSVLDEFAGLQGEIVSGYVQRIERGNIFIDLGRATGVIPFEEQIPGERLRQGERVRAYLYAVEESPRGVFLRLSRSHPKFIQKLFETEAPELAAGVVEIKAIAREPGSRSKIAVASNDSHIDPVGSMVGQRGVRVSTVMSELGGEKIDIIEWSEDPKQFVEDAHSPARIVDVTIDDGAHRATVRVIEDQQSLAIGKAGQNVRLAAKLTGWKIDIRPAHGAEEEEEASKDKKAKPEAAPEETVEPAADNTDEKEAEPATEKSEE
jgi:N utilization substance protein A